MHKGEEGGGEKHYIGKSVGKVWNEKQGAWSA